MKKKLSLLLAAMLVMTLVPVSSFAYGKTVTKSYDAEVNKTGKSVIVEYKVNPGESTISDGTVQFDISNNVKITDLKILNKNNEAITGFGSVRGYNTDTVEVAVTAPPVGTATGNIVDGLLYFTFTLDFDHADIQEGEYVLNAVSSRGGTNISISELKLGTIKEASSTTLAVKVKDVEKTISKEGGKLSEFTVSNYSSTRSLKLELDNDVNFVSGTEVRINRVKVADATVATWISGGDLTIPASNTTSGDDIDVIAEVTCSERRTSFADVNVTVTSGDESVDAMVGSVVDYEAAITVVENGKKEVPSIVGGGKATVKVTVKGVKGSLTSGRSYDFTLNNGSYSNAPTGATNTNNDKNEFTMTARSSEKLEFTMEVRADKDSSKDITLDVTSRDVDMEDVLVAKVNKAFTIETTVKDAKKGETTAIADIMITEEKAGQVKAGQYVYIKVNGRAMLGDTFEMTADNGMTFEEVKFAKESGNNKEVEYIVGAKVKTASKKSPATITISDVVLNVESYATTGKVYDASLMIGNSGINNKPVWDETIPSSGINPNDTFVWADFDYYRAVSEYSRVAPKIVFTLGSANYTVDGVVMTLEAPVFTKDNRTMLPIGPLALAMGLEVNYNGDTQTATFRDSNTGQIVSVKENATILYNNGIEYKMHTAAVTVNGRIFVPVASITDAFGAKILWNESTQTVTIN